MQFIEVYSNLFTFFFPEFLGNKRPRSSFVAILTCSRLEFALSKLRVLQSEVLPYVHFISAFFVWGSLRSSQY